MPALSSPTSARTLIRWRGQDTPNGVTKRTVLAAAEQLGVSETQLIQTAVASFIAHQLPQCESDLAPISNAVCAAIRKRIPQTHSPHEVLGSLLV